MTVRNFSHCKKIFVSMRKFFSFEENDYVSMRIFFSLQENFSCFNILDASGCNARKFFLDVRKYFLDLENFSRNEKKFT